MDLLPSMSLLGAENNGWDAIDIQLARGSIARSMTSHDPNDDIQSD